MAPVPLLKGREERSPDRIAVIHLVQFWQPVIDQQLDAAHTNLDGCNHDNSSGAALAERILHGLWVH
jgi:hypothetical protein